MLQQWRDNLREDHDDVTVRNMDHCQGVTRKIATGDVTTIPPDLLHEQASWRRVPLSSQVAEGWCRSARLVNLREHSDRTEVARMVHSITSTDEGRHSFRLDCMAWK